MATQETYNELVAAVEADAALDSLTSTGTSSIWRLLLYRVAYVWQSIFSALNVLRADVLLFTRRSAARNVYWAVDVIKQFRYNSATTAGYPFFYDPITKKPEYVPEALADDSAFRAAR